MSQKVKRKRCISCRRLKPIDQFFQDRQKSDGRCSNCKLCARGLKQHRYDSAKAAKRYREIGWAQRIKRQYGLTPKEYKKLWSAQQGMCALGCGRPAVNIDHDHETGKVRGLLCRRCNTSLGGLGDNEAGLKRALVYVTKV